MVDIHEMVISDHSPISYMTTPRKNLTANRMWRTNRTHQQVPEFKKNLLGNI